MFGDEAPAAGAINGFTLCYADHDGDGAGDPATERAFQWSSVPVVCADAPRGPGDVPWVSNGLDCDDNTLRCGSACAPGRAEVCDGWDNDCDPGTADGVADSRTGASCDATSDADRCLDDRTGCVSGAIVCVNSPAGDDQRIEVCDPGLVDEDCDGGADDLDPSGPPVNALRWYRDEDGDGFGLSGAPKLACLRPAGYAPTGGDCDDDPTSCGRECAPGLPEVCDGRDNDCAPQTPDGAGDDRVGRPCDSIDDSNACLDDFQVCSPAGLVCVDNPDGDHVRVEVCDGVRTDEDCDGGADDDDPDGPPADAFWWYRDDDRDNYGTFNDSVRACIRPVGFAPIGGDCDDDPDGCGSACSPLTVESQGAGNCSDGHDNDCDGETDDGPTCRGPTACYRDIDLDGYGDPATERLLPAAFKGSCRRFGDALDPIGTLVDNALDCDDRDPKRSPDASEVTASVLDEDCDGLLACWFDADGDGFARDNALLTYVTSDETCESSPNAADVKGDCEDALDRCGAACFPAATEICDGWDNDCNGLTDDAASCAPPPTPTIDGSGGCGGGSTSGLGLVLLACFGFVARRSRHKRGLSSGLRTAG